MAGKGPSAECFVATLPYLEKKAISLHNQGFEPIIIVPKKRVIFSSFSFFLLLQPVKIWQKLPQKGANSQRFTYFEKRIKFDIDFTRATIILHDHLS